MKNCFLLLLLLIAQLMVAQIDSIHTTSNIIYLEAAGPGGYGSLNYERVCCVKKDILFTFRIGAGTYRLNDYRTRFNPDILIPLAINACYGKNHKIEVGVGQTLATIVHASEVVTYITTALSQHCGSPVTPVLRVFRFRDLFTLLNEGQKVIGEVGYYPLPKK